jgi:hypothetical protein
MKLAERAAFLWKRSDYAKHRMADDERYRTLRRAA